MGLRAGQLEQQQSPRATQATASELDATNVTEQPARGKGRLMASETQQNAENHE